MYTLTIVKILVIASIHQPSTTTFELFDKLMLLSRGKIAYNGPIPLVRDYFASLGHSMPLYMNPAEFVIDLVNTDFSKDEAASSSRLSYLHNSWTSSATAADLSHTIAATK